MTEAERIEKLAIDYVIKATGYQVLPEHDHWKTAYIAGATAEHERLQEQLKEKDDEIQRLGAVLIEYGKIMRSGSSELKAAQNLNRELVNDLRQIFSGLMTSSEFRKLYPQTSKEIESLVNKAK